MGYHGLGVDCTCQFSVSDLFDIDLCCDAVMLWWWIDPPFLELLPVFGRRFPLPPQYLKMRATSHGMQARNLSKPITSHSLGQVRVNDGGFGRRSGGRRARV